MPNLPIKFRLRIRIFFLPTLLLLLSPAISDHPPAQTVVTPNMCRRTASIPKPLIIAYASWSQCDFKIPLAVQHGANVIIWFSLTFSSINNTPSISGPLPDLDCVAQTVLHIRHHHPQRDVLHLISAGGWNAPLPDPVHSAEHYLSAFHTWNLQTVARPHLNWHGFDGLDWDPEGHDNPITPTNHISGAHLHLIGRLSVLLKQSRYIVSMAPAQSYLDCHSSSFDLSLTHAPSWKLDFPYHGRNLYAYWLAFYDDTVLQDGSVVPTFDWIGVQVYEGWSRTNYRVAVLGEAGRDVLTQLVRRMDVGWSVDFGQWGGVRDVRVERSRLVIGLANGWALPQPAVSKFLLLGMGEVREAWEEERCAGFMFWTVAEEGRVVEGKQLYLARELRRIVDGK